MVDFTGEPASNAAAFACGFDLEVVSEETKRGGMLRIVFFAVVRAG